MRDYFVYCSICCRLFLSQEGKRRQRSKNNGSPFCFRHFAVSGLYIYDFYPQLGWKLVGLDRNNSTHCLLRIHGVCLNQKHSRLKEITGRGIAYNLIETNCNVGAEIFAPTLFLFSMRFSDN